MAAPVLRFSKDGHSLGTDNNRSVSHLHVAAATFKVLLVLENEEDALSAQKYKA